MTLLPGGTQQFVVSGSWSDGSSATPAVTYNATGGSITAGGLYTAGSLPGTFRVIATQEGGTKSDTAQVVVSAPPPSLVSFLLSPRLDTLQYGQTSQFSTAAIWSDGQSHPFTVAYTATGGTITSEGLYTAGAAPGSFQVAAACSCGRSDTATVVVVPTPVPPPPPPPATPQIGRASCRERV